MTAPTPANGFRTFLIVWATQSISVFGSALTFFATTIWLTQVLYPRAEQKPELAFALSAITLAFSLPNVFGAPIAGAWADRHDRKRTMMGADFISGCVSLALMFLMLTQSLQLWMLIGLTVIYAMAGTFHWSAFNSSYIMIVPKEQLPRANGMMQTMDALSGILSPALAATIISLPALARQNLIAGFAGSALAPLRDGTPLAIAIDALTFFLAAGTLLFLSIPSPQRADLLNASGGKQKSFGSDVGAGATYIWRRRTLLWLLGTFTVANFAASPVGVLQPLIVKFNLADDWLARGFSFESALAFVSSIVSIGGVAGGVLISAWGGLKQRRVYGVVVALIVAGFAQIIYGLSASLFLTAAMGFIGFAMVPIMNAHSQAIWQAQTPPELQGRVFAVRRLIAQFTWPLSTALAGIYGGLFNPGLTLSVLGAILVVFCVAQLFNPYLLRVEDKEWLDRMAEQV